jgi:hypothetical protein
MINPTKVGSLFTWSEAQSPNGPHIPQERYIPVEDPDYKKWEKGYANAAPSAGRQLNYVQCPHCTEHVCLTTGEYLYISGKNTPICIKLAIIKPKHPLRGVSVGVTTRR